MKNHLRSVNLFVDFDNNTISEIIGGALFETLERLGMIHRCWIDNVTTRNMTVGWSYRILSIRDEDE